MRRTTYSLGYRQGAFEGRRGMRLDPEAFRALGADRLQGNEDGWSDATATRQGSKQTSRALGVPA